MKTENTKSVPATIVKSLSFVFKMASSLLLIALFSFLFSSQSFATTWSCEKKTIPVDEYLPFDEIQSLYSSTEECWIQADNNIKNEASRMGTYIMPNFEAVCPSGYNDCYCGYGITGGNAKTVSEGQTCGTKPGNFWVIFTYSETDKRCEEQEDNEVNRVAAEFGGYTIYSTKESCEASPDFRGYWVILKDANNNPKCFSTTLKPTDGIYYTDEQRCKTAIDNQTIDRWILDRYDSNGQAICKAVAETYGTSSVKYYGSKSQCESIETINYSQNKIIDCYRYNPNTNKCEFNDTYRASSCYTSREPFSTKSSCETMNNSLISCVNICMDTASGDTNSDCAQKCNQHTCYYVETGKNLVRSCESGVFSNPCSSYDGNDLFDTMDACEATLPTPTPGTGGTPGQAGACVAIHYCDQLYDYNEGEWSFTNVCVNQNPAIDRTQLTVDQARAQQMANDSCKCVQLDLLDGRNSSCHNGHINGDMSTLKKSAVACPNVSCQPTNVTPTNPPAPTPTPVPTNPPVMSCNSTCTTDAQCQAVDSRFKCEVAGDLGKRCRLASNPSSSNCQPAVGPMCTSITLNNLNNPAATTQDPNLGDAFTLTCGEVPGAQRYIFRVTQPDGTQVNLNATGRTSESFTVKMTGPHSAQCQICTGADSASCLPYESVY